MSLGPEASSRDGGGRSTGCIVPGMPGIEMGGAALEGGPIVRGGGCCKTGTSAVLVLAAPLMFAFASLFRPRNERHMELRDEPLPLLVRSFVKGGARPSFYEVHH